MKIYEIGTGYTPIPAQMGAATEIVVEELTRSFVCLGKDTEIIDIATSKRANTELTITEVKLPSFFAKKDVSLGIMHKLKRVVYSVALAKKLWKIIKCADQKIILHFHNQYNLFFFLKLVPKKYRKKVVIAYTNHSYIWHGDWQEIKDTVKKRYFQEITAMHGADLVFVLNTKAEKNIIDYCGINARKVHLIKNGVNTQVYKPLEDDTVKAIKQRSQLQGKKVLIQVGSVCPRKNQLGSLKLLLPFMLKNQDLVFCYAGGVIDNDYQHQITEFAQENNIIDRVCYFGELKPGCQLNEFYNLAEAMIFPSTAEGFSLTVIEAMSAGIPVIIPSSLIFELSPSCMSFGNTEEFNAIINNMFSEDTYGEIRKNVRICVENNYSWKKIAENYLEFLSLEREGENA